MSPINIKKPGPRHNEIKTNLVEIVTPEGVPLSFEIALMGDRLAAFMLDFIIIMLCVFFIWFIAFISGAAEAFAIAMVVSFFLRNFYFMILEQRWQGSTVGKRNRKIRVVDAGGGQLSVEAIIVRNFTRDIEIFIPLALLMAPQSFWPEAPWYAAPIASLWVLVLGLMPVFNKHRRRIGDLIAGTMVIAVPQVELFSDLAHRSADSSHQPIRLAHNFTPKHLSYYGIYELQVLEKVLRKSGYDDAPAQMALIREKIIAKISWENEVTDDFTFLKEFYAAQRAHLEGRLLMGERREDKHSGQPET
ncbi:MAG: RDD family protein [bacterium]|nr:RDD family protein [bacterium]